MDVTSNANMTARLFYEPTFHFSFFMHKICCNLYNLVVSFIFVFYLRTFLISQLETLIIMANNFLNKNRASEKEQKRIFHCRPRKGWKSFAKLNSIRLRFW